MTKDKKLPSLQWYPGDWRKDIAVQSLSFHDKGVWFEMLMLMHDSEQRGKLILNGHPMSDEMIARAIGLDNQIFNQTLTTLLTTGVAEREECSGAVINRRMVRDQEIREIRILAGSKGGNPVLLNQKSTTIDNQNQTTRVNQKSTPSSSSSSSSSSSLEEPSSVTGEEKRAPRSGNPRVVSPAAGSSPAQPRNLEKGFTTGIGWPAVPDAPGGNGELDATDIARAVVAETGLSGPLLWDAIRAQAAVELNAHAPPDAIHKGMVDAWSEFQRCIRDNKLLPAAGRGAMAFFSEGKWKDCKLWGLKKGQSAWK